MNMSFADLVDQWENEGVVDVTPPPSEKTSTPTASTVDITPTPSPASSLEQVLDEFGLS